jgi:hypothetical protein
MVACNLASGAMVSLLLVAMTLGTADLVMVYLTAVVLAVCDVAYNLALQGSVPNLVPASALLSLGNSRLMAVEGAGEQFLGPGVGGLLFSWARRAPFLGDAISFFMSAWLVHASGRGSRHQPRHGAGGVAAEVPQPTGAQPEGPFAPQPEGPAARTRGAPAWDGASMEAALAWSSPARLVDGVTSGPEGANGAEGRRQDRGRHRSGWAADFRQGMAVFRQQRSLQLLAATVAALVFCQSMVFALLVVYGKRTLHLTSTGYGVFFAAASVVGVLGAFSGGRLQRRFGAGKMVVGGVLLSALSYVGLSFTRSALLAVFVFGLQEIGVAVSNVGSVTTRQMLIPKNLYGRVGGVHRLAVAGAAPVGALLGGLIASLYDVRAVMLTAGALLLLALACVGPALIKSLAATSA